MTSVVAGGRPRDPRVDAALTRHLVQMLAERGPDGFTIDELAARSKVGKAAIYRRYRSREELIEAGFEAINESMPDVSTLPVRQALVTFLEWVEGAVASAITPSWLVAMQQMPQLQDAYRSRVVAPRRRALAAIVRRGQAEGVIDTAADLDVLVLCLSAPAVIVGMHRGDSGLVPEVAIADVVDTVLAGVLSRQARATGW